MKRQVPPTFTNINAKSYRKVKDHCCYTDKYKGSARSICYLKYSIPKEIFVFFHNGLNYIIIFSMVIIKQLPKEPEGEFNF